MIRHAVFCRFSPNADIAAIATALKGLQSKVPGILAISFGANNSPEGLAKGFTHGFTVDFTDAAARDAYLPHPDHQNVGQMIVASVEGGLEGLAVIDWEV